MFGSFRQAVVFDFGQGRLLPKKLFVVVGSLERYETIRAERTRMQLTRWTDRNSDIVYRRESSADVAKYPMPDTDELAELNSAEDVSLTEGNYFHQMQGMLYLEEFARIRLVSRYDDFALQA